MNDQKMDDKNMILIIIGTIFLVFILIFSSIPSKDKLSPSIEWKDVPNQSTKNLEKDFNTLV